MGRIRRRDALGAFIAEARQVDPLKQVFAPAKQHRRDRQVHLVDQPLAQILADGGCPTADPDVPFARRFGRLLQGGVDAVGDEMKVVPPFMTSGSRL